VPNVAQKLPVDKSNKACTLSSMNSGGNMNIDFEVINHVRRQQLESAAPDLLAALIDAENMLDQIRHLRDLDNETWDAIDKTVDAARAALAKATT